MYSSINLTKLAFIYGLLLLTLSTVILYPLFPNFFRPTAENAHVSYLILGWFSTAHVATSGFFYVDKQFIPHIRPVGMRQKLVDISRLDSLGWRYKTNLTDGISEAYDFYKEGGNSEL